MSDDNKQPGKRPVDKEPEGKKKPEDAGSKGPKKDPSDETADAVESSGPPPKAAQQPVRPELTPLATGAIKTLRKLLDLIDTRRAAESLEADGDAASQAQATGLEAEAIPDYKGQDIYVSFDGDNIGNSVARAEASDDEDALVDISARIEDGEQCFCDWAISHGGRIVQSGGDEGLGCVNSAALVDLDDFRMKYKAVTGATVTVGVGSTLSQSTKARMLGKLRGKDQVCYFDDATEAETQMRAEAQGPQTEATKLGDAGLLGSQPPTSETGVDAPVEDGGEQRTSANENVPEAAEGEGDEDKVESVQSGPDKTGGDEEPQDTETPAQPGGLPQSHFDPMDPEAAGNQTDMKTTMSQDDGPGAEAQFVGETPETEDTFGGNPDAELAQERDPGNDAGASGDTPETPEEAEGDRENAANAGIPVENEDPDPSENGKPGGYAVTNGPDEDGEGQGAPEEASDEGVADQENAADAGVEQPEVTSPETEQPQAEEGGEWTEEAGDEDPRNREKFRRGLGRHIASSMRNFSMGGLK